MKIKFVLALTIAIGSITYVNAQKKELSEYKAPNGIIYHVGDTLKLGFGSGTNSGFLWIRQRLNNYSPENSDYREAFSLYPITKITQFEKKLGSTWFESYYE